VPSHFNWPLPRVFIMLWLPLLLFCFGLSFIKQILSFLSPTSLIWVFTCVLLSHRLEFLRSRGVSVQLHWLPHSPPFNQLQQSYCLTPYYWDIFTSRTLPYIPTFWGYGLSFRFLNPEDGTDAINYHYSPRNNPEERRFQLLRGGSLKSCFKMSYFRL
jgi:hypothetical protein